MRHILDTLDTRVVLWGLALVPVVVVVLWAAHGIRDVLSGLTVAQ